MTYVAVKGGREAIENAIDYFRYQQVSGTSDPLHPDQIREQLHLAVDRVMGEGSLYAPDLAALAIKQAAGDNFEAAFMLRAYRTTEPRLGYSIPQSSGQMRVIRRISAAFKEIPGGQILGPTSDYRLRLLNFDLINEGTEHHRAHVEECFSSLMTDRPLPDSFPKVVDVLREEGLLVENKRAVEEEPTDVTRESMTFPAPRSASLQSMARGETGGLLALAYSNMRGYGTVHPTVGELRVGYLPLRMKSPYTERLETVGEIKVTEAEIISQTEDEDGTPMFTLGYGLCFGQNETKAISMAVLDRSMKLEEPTCPSEDQEFVLLHVDGIESMGFCNHYKLPHYVTFQSALDRLRKARQRNEAQ
jgi:alpha-D-ribose 1-methylphosphonate 5-triphosphate synthase subunit PhnI